MQQHIGLSGKEGNPDGFDGLCGDKENEEGGRERRIGREQFVWTGVQIPWESREDFFDDLGGFHAGEAHVEALELFGETMVIDAKEVEQGGVEVADVNHVLDGVVSQFVGGAMAETGFDARARHPH